MNLWFYSDRIEQYKTATSLVVFGAQTFKDAEIVKRMQELEIRIDKLENGIHPQEVGINDFIFTFLLDTIKISLFFENYFKAELLINNFCVNKITNDPKFKTLRKEQFTRPINLEEIHAITSFRIDGEKKVITHPSLEKNTIGFSNLISSKGYTNYYKLDDELLKFIADLNNKRNELHFLTGLTFNLSREMITNLKLIDNFVQETVNRYMTGNLN